MTAGTPPAPRRRRALPLSAALALLLAAGVTAIFLMRHHRVLESEDNFPAALVRFMPYAGNPVFTGTGRDTWDRLIRERGHILVEGGTYRLYYTGYNNQPGDSQRNDASALGYATSPDGYHWTRHGDAPIFSAVWTEDVEILKDERDYFVIAEGKDDVAHALSSEDGLHFRDLGPLDIRKTNGEPFAAGHSGTPALWREKGVYYLYYERDDLGIWLATSTDRKVWTHVDDEPVIPLGPDAYDLYGIAMDQVFRYEGRYYAYYHGNGDRHLEGPWTTSIAVSDDLIHWKKYARNPVLSCNCSSAELVMDGPTPRLYTMHPEVHAWLPAP